MTCKTCLYFHEDELNCGNWNLEQEYDVMYGDGDVASRYRPFELPLANYPDFGCSLHVPKELEEGR